MANSSGSRANAAVAAPESTPERRAYYDRVRQQNLEPLWENLRNLLTPEPVIKAVPHLWRYADLRPTLLESADLISAEEAERRVLMLDNPGLDTPGFITDVLFAGLQLIMPGEVAPAHRHSPSALRFIVEGSGGYTAVNGERAYMERGDFIITPAWTWHDHGHEGSDPVVWLDVLDIPIVRTIGSVFVEHYPEGRFPEGPPAEDSYYRYGTNMRPVQPLPPDDLSSPVFSYPYVRARETLERLRRSTDLDPHFGLKLEYINPTSGGPAMATISTFLQLLPKGFETERYQTTENTIFTPVEGKGSVVIGDGPDRKTFRWRERDIFVIPTWQPYRIEADEDAFIFSASDKIIQTKLGLWKERRGNV